MHIFCHCLLQIKYAESYSTSNPHSGEGLIVTTLRATWQTGVEWVLNECVAVGSLQCLHLWLSFRLHVQGRNLGILGTPWCVLSAPCSLLLCPSITGVASLSVSHVCEFISIPLHGSQIYSQGTCLFTLTLSLSEFTSQNQGQAQV